MQKTWSYNTNFAISLSGDSQLVQGQKILLALKDQLVATGGWSVVGSSDTVDYEYLGVTAGGSYAGSSTGPYDRWEGVADLVRGAEGALHSWCILRKLHPDGYYAYFVLAYRGASDLEGSFYFHPDMPALGADPLRNLPTTTPVAGSMGAFFVYNLTTDTQKGYLCCANDGSFIFATNSSHITDAYTGLAMFHWLEPEEGAEHPFPAVSYLRAATSWTYANAAASFQGWHPDYGNSPVTACTLAYDTNTAVLDIMTGVDSVDGKAAAVPTYFFTTVEGANSLLGRVSDVYLCPSGLSLGDVAPDVGGPSYSPLTTCIHLNNDGQDEYIDFGDETVFSFGKTDSFSVGGWFKFTSTQDIVLIAKHYRFDAGWYVETASSGNDLYVHFEGDSGGSFYKRWYVSANDGDWHHILFTYDGSNGPNGITIYVDGSAGSSAVSGSALSGNLETTGTLRVGARDNYTSREFYGKVCHSFVYDKELSGAEVTAIYGGGVPQDLLSLGPTSNLVHWAALGDGDTVGAGNVNDLSSQGNDGTFVNGEISDFESDVPDTPIIGTPTWWSFSGIWWFPGDAVPEVGP